MPRQLGVSGRIWITVAVLVIAVAAPTLALRGAGFDRWNAAQLRGVVPVRTGWPPGGRSGCCGWARWSPLRGLRRWRHLLMFLGSVVVAGNRWLQPTGNITPLVRRDVIARCGPNLLAVLTSVPAVRGTGTPRALGARVELEGQDSRPVAGGWLRAHGLIPAGVRRGE